MVSTFSASCRINTRAITTIKKKSNHHYIPKLLNYAWDFDVDRKAMM